MMNKSPNDRMFVLANYDPITESSITRPSTNDTIYHHPTPAPTTVPLLGAPSTSTANPVVAMTTTTDNKEIEKEDSEGRFSFGSLHAALGQTFMQDRLKRRQEQEEGQLQNKSPVVMEKNKELMANTSSSGSKEIDDFLLLS